MCQASFQPHGTAVYQASARLGIDCLRLPRSKTECQPKLTWGDLRKPNATMPSQALVEDRIDRYRLREDIIEQFLLELFPGTRPSVFKITVSWKMAPISHARLGLTVGQEVMDTFKFRVPRRLTQVSGSSLLITKRTQG